MDIESFPAHWEFEDSGKQIPKEGLLEVPPTSDEYWRVFEQLRAPTEPVNGRPGPGEPAWFGLRQVVVSQRPETGRLLDHSDGRRLDLPATTHPEH